MNNNNSNVLKVVLLVIVLAIVGYFVYTNVINRDAGQEGLINISKEPERPIQNCNPPAGTIQIDGNSCRGMSSSCVWISGSVSGQGNCNFGAYSGEFSSDAVSPINGSVKVPSTTSGTTAPSTR